ncbi:MAG: hypothetical protein MUE44_01060 [Oscillatoriaceae cyanobacterium Prado104]|nr:hypothetical protein [Oscillatoriaceae cyanobacterium Prado104]
MNTLNPASKRPKLMALLLTLLLGFPFLSACGGSQQSSTPPPPVDDTRPGVQTNRNARPSPQVNRGLNNTQKVAILAGAAALYYLYNQHKNRQGQGPQGQYYLSRNGRVYYRDEQNRAHWVTPPPEGIRVPAAEAERYRDFQGYNNQTTGRDLRDLAESQTPVPVR